MRCGALTLHVRGAFHGNFVDAPLWAPMHVLTRPGPVAASHKSSDPVNPARVSCHHSVMGLSGPLICQTLHSFLRFRPAGHAHAFRRYPSGWACGPCGCASPSALVALLLQQPTSSSLYRHSRIAVSLPYTFEMLDRCTQRWREAQRHSCDQARRSLAKTLQATTHSLSMPAAPDALRRCGEKTPVVQSRIAKCDLSIVHARRPANTFAPSAHTALPPVLLPLLSPPLIKSSKSAFPRFGGSPETLRTNGREVLSIRTCTLWSIG